MNNPLVVEAVYKISSILDDLEKSTGRKVLDIGIEYIDVTTTADIETKKIRQVIIELVDSNWYKIGNES